MPILVSKATPRPEAAAPLTSLVGTAPLGAGEAVSGAAAIMFNLSTTGALNGLYALPALDGYGGNTSAMALEQGQRVRAHEGHWWAGDYEVNTYSMPEAAPQYLFARGVLTIDPMGQGLGRFFACTGAWRLVLEAPEALGFSAGTEFAWTATGIFDQEVNSLVLGWDNNVFIRAFSQMRVFTTATAIGQ